MMTAVPTTPSAAPSAAPSTRQAKATQRWADLDRLRENSAMYDAVIDEIDGRQIRIGNTWLADFASCNYLGFDLEPEIIAAVEPALRQWGTHPSWSRLLGSPRLYVDIEDRLTDLLAAPDRLLVKQIRGRQVALVPQSPAAHLTPVRTAGDQLLGEADQVG